MAETKKTYNVIRPLMRNKVKYGPQSDNQTIELTEAEAKQIGPKVVQDPATIKDLAARGADIETMRAGMVSLQDENKSLRKALEDSGKQLAEVTAERDALKKKSAAAKK